MKKIILAFILVLTMALVSIPAFAVDVSETKTSFTDISKHWAKAEIEKYADTDFFGGKDGKFLPNKIVTRAEFVVLLHKALDIKIKYVKAPEINEFFNDVSNDALYATKLYDLVVSNTIEKRAEFKPDEALPRDEMIHYIINALKNVTDGNYAIIKMMPAPFADDDKITTTYKNDIIEAALLKIVNGRGQNMLYPLNGATRAEAAVAINRLMNTIKKFTVSVEVKPSVAKSNTGLKMKLAITNLSKEAVTINHSSGQKFDFALLDSDRKVLYSWSADKSFLMALTTTVIEAGKTVEFEDTLNVDAYSSIKDSAKYLKAYIVGQSDDFSVNADGYETEIQ